MGGSVNAPLVFFEQAPAGFVDRMEPRLNAGLAIPAFRGTCEERPET